MTQPNPFAQPAATAPVEQQQAQQSNPFGGGIATQQAPAAPAQQWQQPAAQQAQPQQWQQPAAQQAPAAPQWEQPAAPAAQAQTPQYAAGPPMLDPNALRAAGAPAASYSKGPELPDMYSRLVVIFPQSIETVQRNPRFVTDADRAKGNTTESRMTCSIVILDSGPGTPPGGSIAWGGNPQALGGSPHTNNDPLPYVIKGKWISQTRLVSQCREFLPAAPGAAPGMVVGRLAKTGPEHNAPWYLTTATEAELNLARTYLTLVANGQYPHPLAP